MKKDKDGSLIPRVLWLEIVEIDDVVADSTPLNMIHA